MSGGAGSRGHDDAAAVVGDAARARAFDRVHDHRAAGHVGAGAVEAAIPAVQAAVLDAVFARRPRALVADDQQGGALALELARRPQHGRREGLRGAERGVAQLARVGQALGVVQVHVGAGGQGAHGMPALGCGPARRHGGEIGAGERGARAPRGGRGPLGAERERRHDVVGAAVLPAGGAHAVPVDAVVEQAVGVAVADHVAELVGVEGVARGGVDHAEATTVGEGAGARVEADDPGGAVERGEHGGAGWGEDEEAVVAREVVAESLGGREGGGGERTAGGLVLVGRVGGDVDPGEHPGVVEAHVAHGGVGPVLEDGAAIGGVEEERAAVGVGDGGEGAGVTGSEDGELEAAWHAG